MICFGEKVSTIRPEAPAHPSLLRTLGFLPTLSTIHSPHQSLEQIHRFEATFKMFGRTVFEAIEVKERTRLNFEAAILNSLDSSEILAAKLEKVRQTRIL